MMLRTVSRKNCAATILPGEPLKVIDTVILMREGMR